MTSAESLKTIEPSLTHKPTSFYSETPTRGVVTPAKAGVQVYDDCIKIALDFLVIEERILWIPVFTG